MNARARNVLPDYAEYSKNGGAEYPESQLPLSDVLDKHPRIELHANDKEMFASRRRHSGQHLANEEPHLWEKMAVRLDDRIILVRIQDVFWFQSKGNLLCLHLEDKNYDCRMTMKDLLPRLAPDRFLRVHRNAIVNLDHVTEFNLPRYGNAFARFRNGSTLPISRAGRVEVRRSLLGDSHGRSND